MSEIEDIAIIKESIESQIDNQLQQEPTSIDQNESK